MKTKILLFLLVIGGVLIFESFYQNEKSPKDENYIVLGWNDLGMHCSNQDFSKFAILPPYNNIYSQVIKQGDANNDPEIVTDGFNVDYEIPGNTYSVGKTNFWSYEDQLFGVSLEDNIGLTGAGLTGSLSPLDNHFVQDGVPLTPYTDDNLSTEDPYQLGQISVYDSMNNLLASTQPVIPVSNEINCVSSGCHSSEMDILYEHEDEIGFDPNNTPILCAECHSSNALGTPGTPGLGSLSEVIHGEHAEETNNCYKCHPGPETQCHRGVMYEQGMTCQDCHGSVQEVAQSISNGREPWLEEPSCGALDCHGPDYAEEPGLLFRQSKGHGGLYCSACHGSPHAILPSTNARDNIQNIALQGYAGILSDCKVCHGVDPVGAGPHGIFATDIEEFSNTTDLPGISSVFPNPASEKASVLFNIAKAGKVDMDIISLSGKKMMSAVKKRMTSGQYKVDFNLSEFTPGVYLVILKANNLQSQTKLIVK